MCGTIIHSSFIQQLCAVIVFFSRSSPVITPLKLKVLLEKWSGLSTQMSGNSVSASLKIGHLRQEFSLQQN